MFGLTSKKRLDEALELVASLQGQVGELTVELREAREWILHLEAGKLTPPSKVLLALGLIKPEPTREERFWAAQDSPSETSAFIKAWVKMALEFER